MEELIFLLNMKIWSNIDTSPSKPLCRTCPLYIGLFYKMPTGFAGSGADISSFPFPPLLQWPVIKHSWQMFSQPCMFTEWRRQAKSFLFCWGFFFILPCVRACVNFLLAGQTQSTWKRKDDLQPAILLAVSVSVNHSAHQNSSWVARYTGYPAKHIPLDSRIVPELWMLEISTVIHIQTVAVTVTWSLFYLLISIHTSDLKDRKEHLLQMCCAWLDT